MLKLFRESVKNWFNLMFSRDEYTTVYKEMFYNLLSPSGKDTNEVLVLNGLIYYRHLVSMYNPFADRQKEN